MQIARTFHPAIVSLPEKQYCDFKVQMLEWDFCRALIISLPSIVNKIKGSVGQAQIFLEAIKPSKNLFISRKQAARDLRKILK